MSDPELPSPAQAAAILAVGAPFLWMALARAGSFLPALPRPPHRWTLAEALAVLAAPFLATVVLLPGAGLATLLASQLALGAGAALAVILAARRAGLATLGLTTRAPPRAFLAVVLAALPFLVCMFGVQGLWGHVCRALGWETQQDAVRLFLELEGGELAFGIVIGVVVGPWIEELVFRGFLQSALAQVLGERGALALGAALFALLHGAAGLPALFVLSLFLGWLQLRTRCLWVPWSAHALNNGIMLALALSFDRG